MEHAVMTREGMRKQRRAAGCRRLRLMGNASKLQPARARGKMKGFCELRQPVGISDATVAVVGKGGCGRLARFRQMMAGWAVDYCQPSAKLLQKKDGEKVRAAVKAAAASFLRKAQWRAQHQKKGQRRQKKVVLLREKRRRRVGNVSVRNSLSGRLVRSSFGWAGLGQKTGGPRDSAEGATQPSRRRKGRANKVFYTLAGPCAELVVWCCPKVVVGFVVGVNVGTTAERNGRTASRQCNGGAMAATGDLGTWAEW